MRWLNTIAEATNALALGLWAGALAMVGVTAAVAFPKMKDLDPLVPAYALYEGDHWRLAAGDLMNFLFNVVDVVGVAALLVAGVCTFAALFARRSMGGTGVLGKFRMLALAVSGGLMIYAVGVLRPQMDDAFNAHRAAATAGDNAGAVEAQAAFDELHAPASNAHVAQLVAVAAALVLSVASATSIARREPGA